MPGSTKVTLILNGEKNNFSMDSDSNILDEGLSNGYDMPHSCQGGICLTCLGNFVFEGKATEVSAMTNGSNRVLDELAKLVTDAAGAAQGVRREVETAVRGQAERLLNTMDVVQREDFEADALRCTGGVGHELGQFIKNAV
jgi:ferredoxin